MYGVTASTEQHLNFLGRLGMLHWAGGEAGVVGSEQHACLEGFHPMVSYHCYQGEMRYAGKSSSHSQARRCLRAHQQMRRVRTARRLSRKRNSYSNVCFHPAHQSFLCPWLRNLLMVHQERAWICRRGKKTERRSFIHSFTVIIWWWQEGRMVVRFLWNLRTYVTRHTIMCFGCVDCEILAIASRPIDTQTIGQTLSFFKSIDKKSQPKHHTLATTPSTTLPSIYPNTRKR